jgi:Na+/H+-dicarboxylate symporter
VSVDTERIVYEESVRAVAQQRDLLDGLRGRAGTLLAATSVATAFLSAQALRDATALGSLGWSAVVLFCVVVLLTLAILIPWNWTFAHHPHSLIGVHLESENPPPGWQPSTLSEVYRNISYWNGVHYTENGRKLQVMFVLFALACGALAAEIVIWLILLAR